MMKRTALTMLAAAAAAWLQTGAQAATPGGTGAAAAATTAPVAAPAWPAAVAPSAAAPASLGLAIVAQDRTALRAGPHDTQTVQAQLTSGDMLEVRAARLGYLQVWDHRRERGGYVRADAVRRVGTAEADAPGLLAVLRFLREVPGQESLGVAYAAAYLKAVPARDLTPEALDALGSLADRLARRASGKPAEAAVALQPGVATQQLEAVAQYGVQISSVEVNGLVQLCYDGAAFAKVLGMPAATAAQRARAALGLTRHDCVNPELQPQQRLALDQWRAEVLDRVGNEHLAQLVPTEPGLAQRLHLRRAGVWATLAFERQRLGQDGSAAAERALKELALVNPAELADDEQAEHTDAALRVGASRWAAESASGAMPAKSTRLGLQLQPGEPGQTCVNLVDPQAPARTAPLATRCTYGQVWTASTSVRADQQALAVAVQPLAGWRELWVFRRSAQGWVLDVLPPAAANPELGYVDFAGWVPGAPEAQRVLVAREVRSEGKWKRTFEVLRLDGLALDKGASRPDLLVAFRQWQDAGFKRGSVALR